METIKPGSVNFALKGGLCCARDSIKGNIICCNFNPCFHCCYQQNLYHFDEKENVSIWSEEPGPGIFNSLFRLITLPWFLAFPCPMWKMHCGTDYIHEMGMRVPSGCIAMKLVDNKLNCYIFRKHFCSEDPVVVMEDVRDVKIVEKSRVKKLSSEGDNYDEIKLTVEFVCWNRLTNALCTVGHFDLRGNSSTSCNSPLDLQYHPFLQNGVTTLVGRARVARELLQMQQAEQYVVPTAIAICRGSDNDETGSLIAKQTVL